MFPPDPAVLLAKAENKIVYLLRIACKYENKSEEQVKKEMDEYLNGGDSNVVDQDDDAKKESSDEKKQENALFFGHKEKDVYYPMELRQQHPYKQTKEENVRYFANAEEAEAAGYKAQKAE